MGKLLILFAAFLFVFVVSCGGSGEKKTEDSDTDVVSDSEENFDDDSEATGDDDVVSDETVTEEENDIDKTDDDGVTDGETDDDIVYLSCGDIAEGMNTNFMAGEGDSALARNFILRLPENVDSQEGGWPVIFLFHGYGDTASNFEQVFSGEVNNTEMPFILVVPEARDDLFTFGIPPKGLDWDMIVLEDGSAEADLFDAVLECIDSRWGVDDTHIHVAGFSAGAITTDSLGVLRPEKVASLVTFSGAYFSNPEDREDLGEAMGYTVGDFFSWPDFPEDHTKYTQVLVSGDEGKDTWGTMGFTIDFNHMANFDADYLTELGHNVILCNHHSNHTVTGLTRSDLITFFKDHPFGTEVSPYKDGLPDGWDICEYRDQPVDYEPGDSDTETTDL